MSGSSAFSLFDELKGRYPEVFTEADERVASRPLTIRKIFQRLEGINLKDTQGDVLGRAFEIMLSDEGRKMWLAFPSLFDFGHPANVPDSFKATCHIFYGMRVFDIPDDLPKWSGHKNHSALL